MQLQGFKLVQNAQSNTFRSLTGQAFPILQMKHLKSNTFRSLKCLKFDEISYNIGDLSPTGNNIRGAQMAKR